MRVNLIKILYYSVLFLPLLPKVRFYEGVYLNVFEIIVIFLLPVLVTHVGWITKFRIQRILISYWIILLITTLVSFTFAPLDMIGFFKVFKGLIYIIVVFIGFKHANNTNLTSHMVTIGIIAMCFNFIQWLYITLTKNIGLSSLIWDSRYLSSGFSNRYIDFFTGSFGFTDGGVHGIWGSYCILVLIVAISLRQGNNISQFRMVVVAVLVLFSITMSVSRESLLIVLIFIALSLAHHYKKVLFTWRVFGVFAISTLSILGIFLFGEYLPLVQKVKYTIESVTLTGGESNVNIRVNTWKLILLSVINNPVLLFTGFGYNQANFVTLLTETQALHYLDLRFATVPESLLMMGLAYGGILGLIVILFFLGYTLVFLFRNRYKGYLARNMTFMFVGLIVTNSLSGASIIADLLYAQLLLVFGYLQSNNTI